MSRRRQFIDTELHLGLEVALEAQILTGTGTGENFTGLLNERVGCTGAGVGR